MLLIISLLIFLIYFLAFIIDANRAGKKNITPIFIFVIFGVLTNLSNVVYAVNPGYLEEYVFNSIRAGYRSYDSLVIVYFIYLLLAVVSFVSVFVGFYSKNRVLHKFISRVFLFDRELSDKKSLNVGCAIIFVGFIVYLYFIQMIGGLSSLWGSLYLRTQVTAGTGYFSFIYESLCLFGYFFIYRPLYNKSKLSLFIVTLLLIFILMSLGQRGPVLAFLFSIFVYHSYRVKPLKRFLNVKNIIILFFSLFVIVSLVQFRKSNFVDEFMNNPAIIFEDFQESIMSNLVLRMGRLERDIVIVEHFYHNDFWWGASYISLLYAPIPSGMIENKPPLDTGVYLYNIAKGNDVTPPKPTKEMLLTSWPEGNWAGYMNFGIIGLILLTAMSSWVFGFIGRLVVVNNYKAFVSIFFSFIAFGGSITLSPYGIFLFLSILIPVFIISFLVKLRLSFRV